MRFFLSCSLRGILKINAFALLGVISALYLFLAFAYSVLLCNIHIYIYKMKDMVVCSMGVNRVGQSHIDFVGERI